MKVKLSSFLVTPHPVTHENNLARDNWIIDFFGDHGSHLLALNIYTSGFRIRLVDVSIKISKVFEIHEGAFKGQFKMVNK